MSKLILGSELHQDFNRDKSSVDFEAWKQATGSFNPSAAEAWGAQVSYIRELEHKLVEAATIINKSTGTIESLQTSLMDLKNMFEENLKIMGELEIENLSLKDQLNG